MNHELLQCRRVEPAAGWPELGMKGMRHCQRRARAKFRKPTRVKLLYVVGVPAVANAISSRPSAGCVLSQRSGDRPVTSRHWTLPSRVRPMHLKADCNARVTGVSASVRGVSSPPQRARPKRLSSPGTLALHAIVIVVGARPPPDPEPATTPRLPPALPPAPLAAGAWPCRLRSTARALSCTTAAAASSCFCRSSATRRRARAAFRWRRSASRMVRVRGLCLPFPRPSLSTMSTEHAPPPQRPHPTRPPRGAYAANTVTRHIPLGDALKPCSSPLKETEKLLRS